MKRLKKNEKKKKNSKRVGRLFSMSCTKKG